MSEEIVDGSFESAESEVESAHQQAVARLREKVRKAKAEALKNVGQ